MMMHAYWITTYEENNSSCHYNVISHNVLRLCTNAVLSVSSYLRPHYPDSTTHNTPMYVLYQLLPQ